MIAIRINKKSDIPEHFQYIMGNMPADNTIIVFISGDPVLKLAFSEFAKMYSSYALKLRATFHVYIEDHDKRGMMVYDKTIRINFGAYDDDKNYKIEQIMFSDGRDVFPITKDSVSIKIIHDDVQMDPAQFPNLITIFKLGIVAGVHTHGIPIKYPTSVFKANGVRFEYIYEGGVNFTITNVEEETITFVGGDHIKNEIELYKWLSKPFIERIKERYVVTCLDDIIVIQNVIIDSGVNVMIEGFEPVDDLVIKALNYSKAQRRFKAEQEAARKEQERKEARAKAERANAIPHFPNIWRDYIAYDCVGGNYVGAFYECDTAEYDYDGNMIFHGVKL